MNKNANNKNGWGFIIGLIVGLFSVNINMDLKDIIGDFEIYKNLQKENTDLKNQISLLIAENDSLKSQAEIIEIENQTDNNEPPIYNQNDYDVNDTDLIIQIVATTAKIHTAPRNSSNIIVIAKRDDIIVLRRSVTDKENHKWYEVIVGNQIGYIRSYLATQIN